MDKATASVIKELGNFCLIDSFNFAKMSVTKGSMAFKTILSREYLQF